MLDSSAVAKDAGAASGTGEQEVGGATDDIKARPREWHTSHFLSVVMQATIALLLSQTVRRVPKLSRRGAAQLSEDLEYFSNVGAVFSVAGTEVLARACEGCS